MLNGGELKALRIRKGLTQKKLSELIGVSVRYVKMVEAYERHLSDEAYKDWINACDGLITESKKVKNEG